MGDKNVSGKKIIDELDLKEELYKAVDNILNNINNISLKAAIRFYMDYNPKIYNRTFSFYKVADFLDGSKRYKKNFSDNNTVCNVIIEFDSDDVKVNNWVTTAKNGDSRIIFKGDPIEAFNVDYIYGYHGGPRYSKSTGKFVWDNVPQSNPSPYEAVENYIISL